MTLDQKLETAVLITLWIELAYDHWWNSRENRIKRRQKNAKKEVVKPILREGTSGVSKKAAGEVCNLPETPVNVQKTIEPGS